MQGKALSGRSTGKVYIGIDVCKDRLEVYLHPLGRSLSMSNSRDGLKRVKRALADHDVALVVMEATGKHHRLAQRTLHAAGLGVAVINPLRARLFAEARGQLAKTDAIDARLLALYGESMSPAAPPPRPENIEDLQEILRARQAATAERTALKNRRGASTTAFLKAELARRIRNLDGHIKRLEAETKRQLDSDPALQRRYRILQSIPGIGPIVAAVLLIGLAELGACSGKAAALLTGVAPIACDSGQKDGKRHIRGGRSFVRNALYMAGVAAARCNPELKAFYDRLRAKYPAKYALTAVMRKLVTLANTLLKEDRPWQPVRP
ncbi:MAG: IS110 family transposase [Nitrospiraceae bacterium]|nr:IS110 family transposase [Nitrospiraceae bacterium]